MEHVLKHQAGLQDFSRWTCWRRGTALTRTAVKGVALAEANDWDTLVALVAKAGGSGPGPSAYHDLAFAPLVGGIVQYVQRWAWWHVTRGRQGGGQAVAGGVCQGADCGAAGD